MKSNKKTIRMRSLPLDVTASIKVIGQEGIIQQVYNGSLGAWSPDFTHSGLLLAFSASYYNPNTGIVSKVEGVDVNMAWYIVDDGEMIQVNRTHENSGIALVPDTSTKLTNLLITRNVEPNSTLVVTAVAQMPHPTTGQLVTLRTEDFTISCVRSVQDEYGLAAQTQTSLQLDPIQMDYKNTETLLTTCAVQLMLGDKPVDPEGCTYKWEFYVPSGQWIAVQNTIDAFMENDMVNTKELIVDLSKDPVMEFGRQIDLMCTAKVNTTDESGLFEESVPESNLRQRFHLEAALPALVRVDLIPLCTQNLMVSEISRNTNVRYKVEAFTVNGKLSDADLQRYYDVKWTIDVGGTTKTRTGLYIDDTLGSLGAWNDGAYVLPVVEAEVTEKASW